MIGRAAQGQPWLFRQINDYLSGGVVTAAPCRAEIADLMLEHVSAMHSYYGEAMGLRIARKHVGWYLLNMQMDRSYRKAFNHLADAEQQLEFIHQLRFKTNNNNQDIAA